MEGGSPDAPAPCQGPQPPKSQNLQAEALEAPLNGRALAELLQDSPDVVQVAHGSQSYGERDTLQGQGSRITDAGHGTRPGLSLGDVEIGTQKGGGLVQGHRASPSQPHAT